MRHAWHGYLVVGAVAAALYPFLDAPTASVLFLLVSASSVFAVLLGIRLHRPQRSLPWYLLAAASACFVVGDLIYSWYDIRDVRAPYPSAADLIYLLAYPLLILGMGIVVHLSGARDSAAWLDAVTWTVGAVCAAWLPLLAGYVHDPSYTTAERAVALSFPCLDLLLLVLVLHQISRRQRLATPFRLLIFSFACLLAADLAYSVRSLEGSYVSGELTDLGWILSYATLGAAALHPAMTGVSVQQLPDQMRRGAWTFPVLGPALIAPTVLVALLVRGDLRGDVAGAALVAVGSAVVVLLTGLRGRDLITELRAREVMLQATLREREVLAEELRSRATRCPLTGLVNRAGFMDVVGTALEGSEPLSIGLLDLDDFKGVNDTLGHDAGDALLVEVARRLRGAVGPRDLVGRLGGDEFAVLLRGDVPSTADRLIRALGTPMVLEGLELRVEASLGLVPRTEVSALGDLLRRADVAMYAAKAAGGNRWLGYQPEMSVSLVRRIDLRTQIVTALERDEIHPSFQPVVDLETGDVVGFEALARWTRAGAAVAGPADWIALAEQTGLIVAIDFAILESALSELARWRAALPSARELHLAVNVSGRTLQETGTATRVLSLLGASGVPPSALVLEVTEGVLLEDESVGRRLQHLRAEGVKIALDDFGTGWSSLAYLARFPVDVLKLDRSFTATLDVSRDGEAVPAAVVQLALALDLAVIAEGIERPEQVDVLRSLGAQFGQGYLFGRAMPAEQAAALLHAQSMITSAVDLVG